MTDSLKFGPEWLRQLSQDNSGTQAASGASSGVGGGGGGGNAPHRYQLAEHRYGREEMLALFDRLAVSRAGPDLLRSFPNLYVEKPQLPLALVQMTEEETRTWQRGINSESALRGPGKMGVGGPGSLRGGGGASGIGRGGVSMDRGVRGRGRGSGSFYTRGGLGSYEEENSGDGSGVTWRRGGDSGSGGGGGNIGGSMSSSSSFNSRVGRSFDRSQGVTDRSWGERNGTVDSNDWNGSTSPRKDFGRGLMENWRSRGSTEEEETWRVTNRTEKWGRNSWREGGSGSIDRDQDGGVSGGRGWDSGESGGNHHRGRGGGWEDGGTSHRSNLHRHSWEEPDKLPEWATENLSESGGSFDASGAFHGGGGYSDDDEKGHGKDRPDGLRRLTQSLRPLRRGSGSRVGGNDGTRGPILLRTVSESEADHHPATGPGSNTGPSRSVSSQMSERPVPSEAGSSPEGSKGSPMSAKQETAISSPNTSNSSPPSAPITVTSTKSTPPHSPSESTPETQSRPEPNRLGPQNKSQSQPRASSVPASTPSQMSSLGLVEGSVASLEARGQQRQRSEEDLERMQEVADDLVAKLMDEEEDEVEIRNSRGSGGVGQPGSKEEVGACREDAQGEASRLGTVPGAAANSEDPNATLGDKWYYQDPQGIVQGPFGSGEMADWFRAGYFNTTLLVRRACDECFSQLGELMKIWGRIPFSPGPTPPPLKASMSDPAIAAASAPLPLVPGAPGNQVVSGSGPGGSIAGVNPADNLLMQQYRYQMLQRQIYMSQQAAVQAIMEKLSIEHQQSVMQQLMGGSQGQQQPQGPQAQQQNPPHQPPPHHTSADGMNPFLQQPSFKMQTDLSAQKNPVMSLISQIHQQQQAKVSQAPEGLMGPQVTSKVPADPISQLIQHVAMQQQQQQASHQSNPGVPHHPQTRQNVEPARPPSPVSTVQGPGSQQTSAGSKQENDPIQLLIRHLERSNGNPLANQPPVESVWGGPYTIQNWLAQAAPGNGQVAAPPGQHLSQGVTPGGGAPISLWDLQGKDVKTEQQILEEQMRAEEERKKEEIRKQEEAAAKKKVEEEERKRKQLEEELRQKEAEKRRLEEQMRQLEEEKRAEEQRRKEEEKRIAEERRRLEEIKLKFAAEEKKIQEVKRLAEKQKREEAEERKRKEKEEEEARKQQQREQEEEERQRKRQEEERKKQQQIEEGNRRIENLRQQQIEAQRKALESQQAAVNNSVPRPTAPKSQAPWAQQQSHSNSQSNSPPIANLAEIQRMQEKEEKEMIEQKRAQKLREKELAYAPAQMHSERDNHSQADSAMHHARSIPGQQPKSGGSGSALQLKWADKRPQPVGPVKSLAEIQAEEHEQQLARERERAERAAQQSHQSGTPGGGGVGSQGHNANVSPPVGGIWGSATQSLTWAARSAGHGGWAAAAAVGASGTQMNHSSSVASNTSNPSHTASAGLSSSSSSSATSSSNSSPAVWANAGQNSWATNSVASNATSGGFWEEVPVPTQNAKMAGKQGGKTTGNGSKTAATPASAAGGKGKGKSRKDEVMKIFEQNVQRSISAGDEFTQWCLKTLGNLQTSVDIPTFVGFLKDIDSPFEVADYVRNYLGDGKEAREFSRNFLERRSRWRNAQKAAAAPPSEDDMCIPAPAVNPLSSDFQEVKGKGKKAKKNKMLRLDNRILGFSVTASHDRINVGDRDYGEGV